MIAAMLRVKNEARWIERVLASLLPLCDQIFVMDDHSIDDTAALVRRMPQTKLLLSPFEGLDETRDKNWLLGHVRQCKPEPEWIIGIDGDEILQGVDALRDAMQTTCAHSLTLRVLYLWDREDAVRVDGVYARFQRPSVFRLIPGAHFWPTAYAHNMHCTNVPNLCRDRQQVVGGAALLHLGYLHRADRVRKYAWYNAQDPFNPTEDYYRHMVVGDCFPADARFVHGGPLEVRPLSECYA